MTVRTSGYKTFPISIPVGSTCI